MPFPDPLDDNPPELDTRAEIAEEIRSRGHDPMDIRSNQQLQFGWSILNSWEDEPPSGRGGRSEETMALEGERVISAAHERDINLEEPLDLELGEVPDALEDDDLII